MRLLAATSHRRMLWKNGGGETTEVAIEPAAAGIDSFDWRVSMATVATDGPFSRFAGIDRTLTVVEGEGLKLRVGDDNEVALTPRSAPLSFSGEATAAATLLGGPVLDVNVMTRRSRFSHAVRRLRVEDRRDLEVGGATVLLLCTSGTLTVAAGDALNRVAPLDALLAQPSGHARWRLHAEHPAHALVIELSRIV